MTEEYFDCIEDLIKKVNNDAANDEEIQIQKEIIDQEEGNGNGSGIDKEEMSKSSNNGELEAVATATAFEPVLDLDSKIPDKDYSEYVIRTLKKTVKQEDSLVRQICYTGLSAYTNDPINLGIIAPTSEGKTYPVIESIKLFPKEDVWLIGKMSTKMLVRQKGTLVDENNEPLKPKIKQLKKDIENAKKDKDKYAQEELSERLVSLFDNARTLIDLRGKILVFLEPPEHELWNLLKPILSHDSDEIEFPFVDKTERGFEAKRVVVKGWPACIFCSAKDESNWSTWPEIVSRSLITSPNMNPVKYKESNLLIAQRKGLPRLIQQQVIVSDEEIRLAKFCILNLKQQMRNYSSNNNPVWIPFLEILAEALPAEKGPDNRITKRIFSFLEMIVLVKSHLRKKLILGSETQAIAALEDLSQVLYITQNISGIPTYKLKFFKDYFVPLFKTKSEPDSDTDSKGNVIKEKIIGLTTREISEYYKKQTGKAIGSDSLKKIYLYELLNNGYIDEQDSVIDKRQKIYYPIVEIDDFNINNYDNNDNYDIYITNKDKIPNYRNGLNSCNFMQYSRLSLPKYFKKLPKDLLKFELLFSILDENNNQICICQFVEKYGSLNQYFSRAEFKSFRSNLFGEMKFFKQFTTEEYEKLQDQSKFLHFCISSKVKEQNQEQSDVAPNDTNAILEGEGYVFKNEEKDDLYWTKGKWRGYMQKQQAQEFEQESSRGEDKRAK